jgi:hypothetical protein
MQKAAKLALANTIALQNVVTDIIDTLSKDVKTLLNGTVVPDSVLLRHTEQEVERRDAETVNH